MAICNKCCQTINVEGQSYLLDHVGPEITSLIEQDLGREVLENEIMCSECFSNIIATMSSDNFRFENIDANEQYELSTRHVCVWCQRSLYGRQTHPLPEGPIQDLISQRISPRHIPDGGLVCQRCWMRVWRMMQEHTIPVPPPEVISEQSDKNKCVWCLCSLNRRRSHALPEGPERNEILTRIQPRQIPSYGRVCYACWVAACRNVRKSENNNINVEHDIIVEIPPVNPKPVIIQLDNFTHTTNSSHHCFVPSCRNPERLCVPDFLRKHVLNSRKIFITDNARICSEHKSVYNWEFLEQYQFSKNFTKKELESMLNLSVLETNHNIDFENITLVDDKVFEFWTGVTKEKFFSIFNTICPALTCKRPHTALGVYLIKAHTGDSHERISSLLGMSKASISRLLNAAMEALVT